MTAAHSSGSKLTVSRIHRLLRPLRNKCANLANLSTSTSGSSIITYASRTNSTAWTDDLPPLETIPRPRILLARLDLRTKFQAKIGLSQKIWDVLDTFENLLQAAFGKKGTEGQAGRMLTLTEMCAAVVGENLQEEIAREEEDCEDRDGGEEAELAVANELYEAIPEDLRKWTLVSHAIMVILETCPHHPTLLVSLLKLTMRRNLARDSQTLLYALLSVAIGARRSSIYPTPICHPSHASYLQDLCETWTATSSAYFSQRAFTRVLADVLCETESPHVWKCKALSRCTRSIRSTDFPAFLSFVDTLVEVIGRIRSRRRTPRGKSPRSKAAPREHEELRVRLTKWFRSISDHPVFDPDPTEASTEEYQAIVSTVVRARHWGIHLCSANDADASTDPTTTELPSALVCLAVQCLSAPLFSTLGSADSNALAGLLRDVHPTTSTCDELVQQHFAAGPDFAGVMRALRGTAAALRAHALAALEASFWVCALRHFERDAGAARGERAQLMEAVSEAERLRFAGVGGEGEWEWEEMIGCWVRRAPEVMDQVVRVQRLGGLATGRTRAAVPFREGARTKPASVSSSSASSSRQSSSQQSSSSRGSKRSGASTPPTEFGESAEETSDGEWDPEEDPLLLSPRRKKRKIVHTPIRQPSVESSEEDSPQQAQNDYMMRLPSEDGTTSEEEGVRRRQAFKVTPRRMKTRVVLTDEEEEEPPRRLPERTRKTLKGRASASLFKGNSYPPLSHGAGDTAQSSRRHLVLSEDEEEEQRESFPPTNITHLVYSEDEDDDEPEESPVPFKHTVFRAPIFSDAEDGISGGEGHASEDESDTLEGEIDTYEPTQSQSDEGTADEELTRPAPHRERATKQRRRLSNFTSLLRDAQRSVTDLRAERRASQTGVCTQVRNKQPAVREEARASRASQARVPPALPRSSHPSTRHDIQHHTNPRNHTHRETNRPNTAATSISAEMHPHAIPRKRQRRASPPPRTVATGHPSLSQSRRCNEVIPASDDSLNLFAYSDT